MIHDEVCKHCDRVIGEAPKYSYPQSPTEKMAWCPQSPTGTHEPVAAQPHTIDPPRRRTAKGSSNTTKPLVVSVRDAATMLGVSSKTVWRMIAARQIEVVTIAATKKIRVREIERYLTENSTPVLARGQ